MTLWTRWTRALAPCVVAVAVGLPVAPAAADGLRIVPIEPVPGAHVLADRPTIAFEVHSTGEASVARERVHVGLDGRAIDDALQIAGNRLEIVPPTRLGSGTHEVDVTIDDGSGGSANERWSFRVDPSGSVPTVRDDASAGAGSVSASDGGTDAYVGGYGDAAYGGAYGAGYGAFGGPYGSGGFGGYPYGFGAFYPLSLGPYYYGEPLRYIYNGYGAGGFVTIGGFPGSYPLVGFGPNYYLVTVTVPSNYNYGQSGIVNPIATLNCPQCGKRRLLQSPPVTLERRARPAGQPAPPYVARTWRPTVASVRSIVARQPHGVAAGPHGPLSLIRSEASPARGTLPRVITGSSRSDAAAAQSSTAGRSRPYVERPYVERPYVERPYVERPYIERPSVERPYVGRFAERPVVGVGAAPIVGAPPAHVAAPRLGPAPVAIPAGVVHGSPSRSGGGPGATVHR